MSQNIQGPFSQSAAPAAFRPLRPQVQPPIPNFQRTVLVVKARATSLIQILAVIGLTLVKILLSPLWLWSKILHLEVYGSAHRSSKTQKELFAISSLLGGLLLVGVWAWNDFWRGPLEHNPILRFLISLTFASSIVILDRSRIVNVNRTIDERSKRSDKIRVGLMLVMCSLTFVSSVIATYRPDVRRYEQEHMAEQVTAVRAAVIRREVGLLETADEAALNTANASLNEYRASRATDYADLQARNRDREHDEGGIRVHTRTTATNEAIGRGPTGRRGTGPNHVILDHEANHAEGRVDATRHTTDTELANHTNATHAEVARREQVRNSEHNARALVIAQTRDRLQGMSPAALMQRYAGAYELPKGHNYQMLMTWKVMMEHPFNGIFCLICLFLAFAALDVISFSTRELLSVETMRYLDVFVQASLGHPDALKAVQAMGIKHPSAYADIPEIKDAKKVYDDAMSRCLERAIGFKAYIVQLATQRNDYGLSLAFPDILVLLLQRWNDRASGVAMALDELRQAHATLTKLGVPMPTSTLVFPAEVNLRDETACPWDIRVDLLIKFGWVDPQPALHAATPLLSDLHSKRVELHAIVDEADEALFQHVLNNDSLREIQRAMNELWLKKHFSQVLRELGETEVKTGILGSLSRWPTDPRAGLEDRVRLITKERLERMGWEDPEAVQQPTAAPAAAPVVPSPFATQSTPVPPIKTN